MKVSLPSKAANCRAYGLEFDLKGIAEADAKVVKSLVDTGALIEVKATKKATKK